MEVWASAASRGNKIDFREFSLPKESHQRKSVTDKIADSVILYESATQNWEELHEMYGQSNAPQMYQFKKDLSKIEQEGMSIADYYCKLKVLWDEISHVESYPYCECDARRIALNASKQGGQMQHNGDFKREKLENLNNRCDHCGMRGHTKDECFKIYGYPDWYKNPKGKGKGKMAANVIKEEQESIGETPLDCMEG
ncbi:Zinc finger CCHC domain-containing protein 18 [Bienertia sinuspersici]